MNGIDKIIGHINSESASECDSIAKTAAEECDQIRADYAKAEQDQYWQLINEGTKDAERRLERLNSLAALESKKHVLATQQELIVAAFDLAAKKLLELPRQEYVTFLAKLASAAAITGTESIVLSASDLQSIGSEVRDAANSLLGKKGKPASLTLSNAPANIRGGLILSGGDIEANCSVDSLVSQYRNELSPRVATVLFE